MLGMEDAQKGVENGSLICRLALIGQHWLGGFQINFEIELCIVDVCP